MTTIVLAAGQGIRLRPLTADRPKAMLSAAGRPLLSHLLASLGDDVVLVVGHGARAVQAFVGDGDEHGVATRYVQQEHQLGPGHALLQAHDAVDGDEVLVLPGDAWLAPSLVARLQDAPCPAMVQVPDARSGRHGVPVIADGRVTGLQELEDAGGASLFCGGAYKLPARFFAALEAADCSLRDAIRRDIAAHGPWDLVRARPDEYVDVIEVQDLLTVHDRLMHALADHREGTVEAGAVVTGPLEIGEGSVVRAGAVVQGPVSIGKHCDIGPGAVLLPGASLRNHVHVGAQAVLGRCSLASNIRVGPHGLVQDAVVDNGAVLGAFAQVTAGAGAIVGADAVLGDRCTVAPGGVVGRGATVAAGRNVQRVPDGGQAV